ncbi:hypothetical protein ACQWDC_24530, partial [Salmonella enterica subsp. enterica serovar Infantis]
RNASLKAASRKDYYLRAGMVEYAGVANLHVLCTSGLLRGVITDEPDNGSDRCRPGAGISASGGPFSAR